jgi:hypothetical protein
LLLALDSHRQILVGLPVNSFSFGVIIDEVSSVAILLAIEVGLRQSLVGEELIGREFEDELETRTVEVLHANVCQVSECLLILIGDELGKGHLILHRRQPEFGDALGILSPIRLGLCLLLVFLVIFIFRLAGFDFSLCRFALAVDDLGPLLVQRCEFGKVFLFEVQNFLLEFSLKFGVFLLDAFQASDPAPDGGWEALNVAGRTPNKCSELSLDHRYESGVLSEDRSSSGAVKILCDKCQSDLLPGGCGVWALTFLDARNAGLLSTRRDGCIVCWSYLQ